MDTLETFHPQASKHQPRDEKMYATILGALVAPMSRGNITIRSASALDAPVISPNWLIDQRDQEVAVAWYRRMRDVWRSKALQSIVLGEEAYPGADVETDEEVLNVVRNSVMTVWHPACTCKMGRKDDKMAVVDNRARVYGVSGLRVVDASAMPFLPPGHPQSTIYALAEKTADDIIHGGPQHQQREGGHQEGSQRGGYDVPQKGYREGEHKGGNQQGGYEVTYEDVQYGEYRHSNLKGEYSSYHKSYYRRSSPAAAERKP